MGRVRPFAEEDIPRIIELNTKLFPGSAGIPPDIQHLNFSEVCFHNPWRREGIESLVYEDDTGLVVGFIAIVPRAMQYKGREITVATFQHLMVDPAGRSPFAGIELFRVALAGKQDLSISDRSADISRRMWQKCGGSTVFGHSTYWMFWIRPLTFALALIIKHHTRLAAGKVFIPVTRALDALITRIPWGPWYRSAPETVGKMIDTEEHVRLIAEFSSRFLLRPLWNVHNLGWLMDLVAKQKRWGSLERVAVCSKEGQTLGWFIYYANPGGVSEVLQIGANEKTIDQVLSHLFYHAWKRGVVQLTGRMNPLYARTFSKKGCWFMPGHDWMLIHSKDRELTQAMLENDAWFTRIEGDLWIL